MSERPLKVLCVFGTRPEAIKMAPVVRALVNDPKHFTAQVVVTAQHREMLDQVLTLFQIESDEDLNVMQQNQSLEYVVAEVLTKLSPLLKRDKPELVLVHGDTITTFAASLAAYYQKIPVGHVEAGLRSFDMENPFPEESNRVLADHLCSLHFAPTPQAQKNLLQENIASKSIFITGNTVTDALQIALKEKHDWREAGLQSYFKSSPMQRIILLTAHRRENHGAPLANVFRGLRQVVDKHPDVCLIYPVHLNPQVQKPARELLADHKRILLIPPVDYLDLVNLMKKAFLIVTDSGGIQEEAPALGKPVLVLRKVTERPEAVQAGTAKVIGTEENDVIRETSELLDNSAAYGKMAEAVNPYGDGEAARRTLEAILFHFGRLQKRPQDFSAQ